MPQVLSSHAKHPIGAGRKKRPEDENRQTSPATKKNTSKGQKQAISGVSKTTAMNAGMHRRCDDLSNKCRPIVELTKSRDMMGGPTGNDVPDHSVDHACCSMTEKPYSYDYSSTSCLSRITTGTTSFGGSTFDSFAHELQRCEQLCFPKQGAAGDSTPPPSRIFADRMAKEFAAFVFEGRNEVLCVEEVEAGQRSNHPYTEHQSTTVWCVTLQEPIAVHGREPCEVVLTCRVCFTSQFPFAPPTVEIYCLKIISAWSDDLVATYSRDTSQGDEMIASLHAIIWTRLSPHVWTPASDAVHCILKESLSLLLCEPTTHHRRTQSCVPEHKPKHLQGNSRHQNPETALEYRQVLDLGYRQDEEAAYPRRECIG